MDLITSVYDQPQYFEEWIESVKNQGFNRIIVGIDGRHETIKDIVPFCNGLAEVYLSVEHVGIPVMLNSLFLLSENDIVCKLDADDIARPNMLNELNKGIMSNPEASVVLSRCRGFGETMTIGKEGKKDYPSAGAYNVKHLIQLGGFNSLIPTFSDTEYFYRLKACGKDIRKTDVVVVDRRLHGDNYSEISPTRQHELSFLKNALGKYNHTNYIIPLITTHFKRII